MKIAYVYLIYGSSIGVEKIYIGKANNAKNLDLDIDFHFLNTTREKFSGQVNYAKIKPKKFPWSIYERYFKRYNIIERTIDLSPYDYIIVRYPGADKSGIEFTEKYNVITEHHSDEISELLSRLKSKRPLKEKVMYLILYLQEKRYGRKVLRNCKGLIAVTEEIKQIELSKANHNIPAAVIANGIEVNKISFTGFKKFNEKNLDIVFLLTSASPWHGFDRILRSLNDYTGDVKIILHVIGHVDRNILADSRSQFSNIKFHGTKIDHELDNIIKNMNVAIASLALFRNNMQEACTLKTREYTARGIPFILAYKDPDLVGIDEKYRFCLYFENDDSRLDMDKIISFVAEFNNNKDISTYMRKYALKNMDMNIKMKQYEDFVKKLGD